MGHLHQVLKYGISIPKYKGQNNSSSTKFVFIGYSNSQLKAHSCWFLCSQDGDTKNLGHIKSENQKNELDIENIF